MLTRETKPALPDDFLCALADEMEVGGRNAAASMLRKRAEQLGELADLKVRVAEVFSFKIGAVVTAAQLDGMASLALSVGQHEAAKACAAQAALIRKDETACPARGHNYPHVKNPHRLICSYCGCRMP